MTGRQAGTAHLRTTKAVRDRIETCEFAGCDCEAHARGLCSTHYARLRRYGNPAESPTGRSMRLQRAALARLSSPDALEPGECWEWPGKRLPEREYGIVAPSLRAVSSGLAHRNAYVIVFGPLPDDLSVCHHCDNPPCFRPSHLFAGTHQDNMLDKVKKGRARVPRGSRHPRASFTDAEALSIRARYAAGESAKNLAAEFGVAASTVHRLVGGRRTHYELIARGHRARVIADRLGVTVDQVAAVRADMDRLARGEL